MDNIEFLVVAVMVAINAVFAAYEIALASVTLSRLQVLVNAKHYGAVSAVRMKEGIEKSLAVVQLGITLVGLLAGATGGASASEDLQPMLVELGMSPFLASTIAIALIVVPLTAVTIVVGELVPKLFALRNKEWVCLSLSPVMELFSLSVWPLVWLLESSASGLMALSEQIWIPRTRGDAKAEAAEIQELRAIVALARTSRLIGSREENIILGAARLASRSISEILIPAASIRMLHADKSLAENLIAAHLDMHTRFPVCERTSDPQSIVGYVTFKDIVSSLRVSSKNPSIRGILRNLLSVQLDIPISVALETMLKDHAHIAMVRDASNTIVGMVTLEDIVEELIGEIHDEYDVLPSHIVSVGAGWIVGGGTLMTKLGEVSHFVPDTSTQAITLNDWLRQHLGRDPIGGDETRVGNHRILVRKTRRSSVLEVMLDRLEQ